MNMINHIIISTYLITYLIIYILTHFPLDIIMYIKSNAIDYPNPPFRNSIETFLFVGSSISFWICVSIFPLLSLFFGMNLFTSQILEFININLQIITQILGGIILTIGLLIGCLGRIGRGLYLSKEKPTLAKTWGHSIVRHPSYFHYISGFIGLPLFTFNPIYLLFILGIPAYINVSISEDNALENEFGEDFRIYKKKVGLLLPKLKKKELD